MQSQFITLAPHAKKITGQRFGRLVALGPIARQNKRIMWLCQCDCGQITIAPTADLRNGHTRSCGCLLSDFTVQKNTSHGLSHEPLYQIWLNIIKRCTNPAMKHFASYGGRGIAMCDEWRHDFASFYEHVSKLPYCREKGYSLDRIDNDGNYEPGNLQWSTQKEQCRNRRTNHVILFGGKTQSLAAWSEESKMPYGTLAQRLRNGWSIERTLSTPVRSGKYRKKK